jgi:hypothetical protein
MTIENISVDALFGHVVDALSDYRYYLRLWKERDTDFSSGYLLACILVLRGQLKRLAAHLESLVTDDSLVPYQEDVKRLATVMQKTNRAFDEILYADKDRTIEALASFRLSESENILEIFLRFYEDMKANGMECDEEVLESLKDRAREFLRIFLREKEMLLEMEALFGSTSERLCNDFLNGVNLAEKRLRTYFHNWAGIRDVLDEFKVGVYTPIILDQQKEAFWWFFEIPVSEQDSGTVEKNQALGESLLAFLPSVDLKGALLRQWPNGSLCPEELTLAMYAADELSYKEKSDIRIHLLVCEKCAREVVILETAMQEPISVPGIDVLLPAQVNQALEDEITNI